MKQKIDFIIDRACTSDAAAVFYIEKECFSLPWSETQVEEEIKKENVIFLVAKGDDCILGYVSGQMILDEFYISNIAVTEKYRGFGIASALLEKLIIEIEKQPCAFATLEVRYSNDTARKLYEKFGFINLGTRKDFYSHPKEDACIYTLYISENEVNHL